MIAIMLLMYVLAIININRDKSILIPKKCLDEKPTLHVIVLSLKMIQHSH